MTRYLDISLDKRGVTCVGRLLDDLAPRTCDAVWNALPLGSDVYHAKYARNEIYTLVEAFADPEPGRENPTPATSSTSASSSGSSRRPRTATPRASSRIAPRRSSTWLFYERNNLLLNPDYGFVPANVFATIVRGLDELAAASQDLWKRGVEGETLSFRRREGGL